MLELKIIYKFYKNYLSQKRKQLQNSPKVRNFIFRYYADKDASDDLFECNIQGYIDRILFLTNNHWINKNIDIFRVPNVIVQAQSTPLQYRINKRMIKKRKLIGQRLFDDNVLYLSRILPSGEIEAKICTFFQKLTLIDKLETETLNAAKCPIIKTRTRDTVLQNFNKALKPMNLPISLGCHVVLMLKLDGDLYVALHERSEETYIYGGAIATVPVFGMVPIPTYVSTIVPDTLKQNILFYNIIKEYCEELYDKEVLQGKENHNDPFWFYEKINEAKELIFSLQNNTSHCKLLGYGFDAISGLSILASLLYVENETLARNIFDNCKANWETSSRGIKFYKTNAPELRQFLEKARYQNGTAFALSQALEFMKNT